MPKRLPEHWKHTYCAFIAEGYTRSDAAEATGVALGTVRRHAQEDQEFRDMYADARETVQDKLRNRIWGMGMTPDLGGHDPQTQRWALDHLIKWNLPEARETNRVEVDVSGQVAIEDRSSSLREVALVLAAVGALPQDSSRTTGPALPATPELLPAPPDS